MTEHNTDLAEKSLEMRLAEMTRRAEKAEAGMKEISDRLYKAGAISVGCSARAERAEVARLAEMVDWLAMYAVRDVLLPYQPGLLQLAEKVKEAARKASDCGTK